jgi:hypothetical protein
MKILNSLAIFGNLLALTACATLGMGPDPNSATKFDPTDSAVHQAYGQYTATNIAATNAETKGTITRDDAIAVLALTDKARPFIDEASALENIDAAAAGDKLQLATAVLAQVQAYIDARAAPKKPTPAPPPAAHAGST